MSTVFSIYYLFFPRRALEKNNMMLKTITPVHMRRSWEKMLHPVIRLMTWINAPKLGIRREIQVQLEKGKGYHSDATVILTIFFKGTEEEFARADSFILDIPGGG